MSIGILAMGAYVPDDVVDNDLIGAWADTTSEWIVDRTGVYERRYACDRTPTSVLAHRAVLDMLSEYPDALRDVAAIVLATSTPDQPQPSTALILQDLLGLSAVPAFDINAVCSGFVYAVVLGAALAKEVPTRRVLVVGADKYSSIMDGRDRGTVSLFGDGAGAVVLGPVPDGYGVRASKLRADGQHRELVEVIAGGTRRPLDAHAREAGHHLFRMRGPAVRDYVLETLPALIKETLVEAGLDLNDIDRFILHQANPRLLEHLTRELGVDPGRVPLTAPLYGNTASASIPITLRKSQASRPLARGENLLIGAVGGSMTAGVAVITHY